MRDIISQMLQRRKKAPLTLEGYKPSAVLVPLFLKRGKYHLLFTQRSLTVKDHKGQISFPGGVKERQDKSLQETALRESQEELGIPPQLVEILGELGDILTPTRYRITPFVGMIPHPFSFKLNRQEIEQLIEVPLDHLLKPANLTIEKSEFFDEQFDSPYFHYREHTIWGATGRITRELVELIQSNRG